MNLGVYIQVPFCQTRCTYCNFHTGVVARDRYRPYANAVRREIAESFASGPSQLSAAKIDTVYMGGGTPSLLEPVALAQIIQALRSSGSVVSDARDVELTLEADPETISSEKADAWRAAGFNRISLGVQSFDDRVLQAAGRLHRREHIFSANAALGSAGITNVSMDLIAGLAHQTAQSWQESLDELLQIRPEHVSIYMLEIDEGSRLGNEVLSSGSRYSANDLPTDDESSEYYGLACERLDAAGYDHYEISNWALPGRRSRHNLKYWQRVPYLGFGAGAHSFDGSKRWSNVHDAANYVSLIEQGSSPREQIESVTQDQALEEEIFLGLRQLDGIDLARIEREYDAATLHDRVKFLQTQGLVELKGSTLRIAPDKLSVSNEIFTELLA
jgi:oxygen-independent coproporphyrinogen-3 oxidase